MVSLLDFLNSGAGLVFYTSLVVAVLGLCLTWPGQSR